ncbi:CASP C terminal-domain-containing protein [Dunaliella salina]|uniref:CASP C terminal-domain-containing protein n=1 Tax=Dunaliella salina TaxID=3046 RepID=A0ABQ7G867_DUNSA|nr:CASP C terminal-domain-containing protein [Dunaliella salina]|eukprot:KAF5830799.1 CASP C terminal-domain-containing protein [Dunaliella salina]
MQGPATPDSSDPSSTSSLLDIVISQRDRFRQRMGQLEEEKGTLSEQLAHAQKQLDSCRADNISLYEKVRFIEQYSQPKGGGGGKGGGPGGGKLQVVRVDGAGIPLESEVSAEQRAGTRYQCGPLAFEIGGGADGGGSGADGGRGTSSAGGLSSGGVRARAAGPRKVQAFCFPADDTQADEEAGGAEARYARAYEARVNPFTDFQKSEMETRALLYFAMLPNKHVVEMVDMGAVAQQQEAAGQGGKVGRRLLRRLFDHVLACHFSHGSSGGQSALHNLRFTDQEHE